jgi:hypothetical protein
MGGAGVFAAGVAIPMAAAIAAEEVVNVGISHMGAVRDVEAVMTQQAGRITPFNPSAGVPDARNFRGELGLFTGAGAEAGGLRRRAKELADSVKEMTSLLGTSMEEGLTMMAELRQAGFEGAAAPGAVLASRGRGRLGGFTAGEMHAVGMRGAQMFRGTGISPSVGFNAAQSSLAQVSDMVNNNVISNDLVASMGGRQRMAEGMTQSQLAFLQGGAGRAFLAAGAGGQAMDFISGRANLADAAMQGIGGRMDPTQMAMFLGRQGQIAGELGPEMIQAAQQRTLFEIAQRGGVKLEGLNRDQQIQALAGLAQTPMGQRVLGIRGPEQAMLLATQAVAAPETMARQAQAMQKLRPGSESHLQPSGTRWQPHTMTWKRTLQTFGTARRQKFSRRATPPRSPGQRKNGQKIPPLGSGPFGW